MALVNDITSVWESITFVAALIEVVVESAKLAEYGVFSDTLVGLERR
jgi:hypothetical protein